MIQTTLGGTDVSTEDGEARSAPPPIWLGPMEPRWWWWGSRRRPTRGSCSNMPHDGCPPPDKCAPPPTPEDLERRGRETQRCCKEDSPRDHGPEHGHEHG
jgi:hypothetical protein